MIKITDFNEIMENEELMAKLKEIETEEEFNELCKEYDFSGLSDGELDEEDLETVAGGFIRPLPISPSWGLVKKWMKKFK